MFHAYHPGQRREAVLKEQFERLEEPHSSKVGYEKQISLRIESLEDPLLQEVIDPALQIVRGRLGQLGLLPEIEQAVLGMEAGEERFVEVHFPEWYPLQRMAYPQGKVQYAGQSKAFKLTLLAIKDYSVSPTLADEVFKGLQQHV